MQIIMVEFGACVPCFSQVGIFTVTQKPASMGQLIDDFSTANASHFIGIVLAGQETCSTQSYALHAGPAKKLAPVAIDGLHKLYVFHVVSFAGSRHAEVPVGR